MLHIQLHLETQKPLLQQRELLNRFWHLNYMRMDITLKSLVSDFYCFVLLRIHLFMIFYIPFLLFFGGT